MSAEPPAVRAAVSRAAAASTARGEGPAPEPALLASGVRHRYGRAEVLRGVDLSVPAGASLLLTGRNGSGKSTLLRLLAGLERPTAGSIRIAGHDTARAPARARRAVALVAEVPSFDAELSPRESLSFHAHCAGLAGREAASAVEGMLDLVDLREQRARLPAELSRGQRHRLAIARALVQDPEVLLLDEPLASLDTGGQAELVEVLYELRAIGKTVVVATQAPEALAEWAAESPGGLAVLADGLLVAGSVDEFRSPGQRERVVRLVVLAEAPRAAALLAARPDVTDLQRLGGPGDPGASGGGDEAAGDGGRADLRFVLRCGGEAADPSGDEAERGAAALAAIVGELVRAGVPLAEVYAEAPALLLGER